MKPKLLLHICCACCTPKILDFFEEKYEVTGFWFNPNIQPETEHSSRYSAMKNYLAKRNISLIAQDGYRPEKWTAEIEKTGTAKPERCRACWQLRLEACAREAKKENMGFFSTTMLSSPYQDFDVIKNIGGSTAETYNLEFVSSDLREHYYKGVDTIKGLNLFTQKYCGCAFSREEREAEKKKKQIICSS